MDIDSLDLDTLKALAQFALDQLEDPYESTFAFSDQLSSPMNTKELTQALEDMRVTLSGDYEGEPEAEINSSDIQSIVDSVKEQVEPWTELIAKGVGEEQERFVKEFQAVLSLTVSNPVLLDSLSIPSWWDRAAEQGVLRECFTALFRYSTVDSAQAWLADSPSMSSRWRDLVRAWESIESPQRREQWLGLVVETPTLAQTYPGAGNKTMSTNPVEVRQAFFNGAWQAAQTTALLVRSGNSASYQSLANALRNTAEVTCGLESLQWERLFYDGRQPHALSTPTSVQEALGRLKQAPVELVEAWLSTPDDAPVNWDKVSVGSWGGPNEVSHSTLEYAVRQVKQTSRKLILPELERLAAKLAKVAQSPELAKDYTHAFRGFSLDHVLPTITSPALPKTRF